MIAITDRNRNFGQNDLVEHRGIRYAIRIGIARERWRVAILFPGTTLPKERTVSGTRKDAETAARSMINAWLEANAAQSLTAAFKQRGHNFMELHSTIHEALVKEAMATGVDSTMTHFDRVEITFRNMNDAVHYYKERGKKFGRASSLLSDLAAERRPGSSSK